MDDESFTAFFSEDFDRLVGFLRKQGYDQEIAQDAAVEAMIKLLEAGADVAKPRAWVRTVAGRTASRLVLEGRRMHEAALADCRLSAIDQADDHKQRTSVEERPIILELLRQLPDMQRIVMAWHLDGFEAAEIADRIGAIPGTVRSNLRHARKQLIKICTRQATELIETTSQAERGGDD